MIKNFFVFLFCLFFSSSSVFASELPNNKFGIHLAVPNKDDLIAAAKLVNSNGGDWGYVTLVIQDNDLDQNKWQGIFDHLRELHVIPLIRLATHPENEGWARPTVDQAEKWAIFLDSLNWVVKNRYVILFNEPNHATEWGGEVDPANYQAVAQAFITALKNKNPDFFVMLAAFDAAAPHQPPRYESEAVFLRAIRDLFPLIDGWASHSYQGEEYLKSPPNLPVFITETGFRHAEGIGYDRKLPTAAKTATLTVNLLQKLIRDPHVTAVTPFLLNYQAEPFDHFSWQKFNSSEFYPQYGAIQDLAKVAGEPRQEQKLVVEPTLSHRLLADSTYQIPIKIKNEGQAIWSKDEGYQVQLQFPDQPEWEYFFTDFTNLKPFQSETLWLHLKTEGQTDPATLKIAVAKNGETISNLVEWPVEVLPPINLELKVPRLFSRFTAPTGFKLVIYDSQEQVVYVREKLTAVNGRIRVEGVNNLTLDQPYRLVMVKDGYLPRQTFLTPDAGDNSVVFKLMLLDLQALLSL
ncbi:MAG: hypothetical protein ABH807_00710 [Candidatus Shapirobacteria bacterium]